MDRLLSKLAVPKLAPIGKAKLEQKLIFDEEKKAKELLYERQIYNVNRLNDGQKKIFEYIMKNKNNIIIIQAGPGTGKTFTLMSIAHAWNSPVTAIIYKHDLLSAFKYVAKRYTIAKFTMELLSLNFYQYQSLEIQLSGRLNGVEFLTCMICLLSKARMPNIRGSLVILDEYTVVPKPLLLLILMLLKYHKIGTIICGDKNQLQNIHNSAHTKCLSSFDIAVQFCDKTFSLEKNERCTNTSYNDIIEYISEYSSDKKLDNFAYAIIAVLFPKQLAGTTKFSDIHLAATHRELTIAAHMMVIKELIPTSFYYIDCSRARSAKYDIEHLMDDGLIQPEIVANYVINQGPDKFLPYLPLSIGTTYYVNKHSEFSQAKLIAYDEKMETLLLRTNISCEEIYLTKNSNDDSIFDLHKQNILNGGNGKIYNYPIYPANFMSIHKCQGCTIHDNLDLHMKNANYQGLYVALSRVRDPDQIVRIIIPNMISHLASSLINFPEHALGVDITSDILRTRMINYVMYDFNDPAKYANIVSQFLEYNSTEEKLLLRDKLIVMVKGEKQHILQAPKATIEYNEETINRFIAYKEIFMLLSCINEIDRNIWLHEFILHSTDMLPLRNDDAQSEKKRQVTVLVSLAGLNNTYPLSMSSLLYIEKHATTEVICFDKIQYIIKHLSENIVLTTTEFRYKIYDKYQNNKTISLDWLIDELNTLVKAINVEYNPVVPTKIVRPMKKQKFFKSINDVLAKNIKTTFSSMKRK